MSGGLGDGLGLGFGENLSRGAPLIFYGPFMTVILLLPGRMKLEDDYSGAPIALFYYC